MPRIGIITGLISEQAAFAAVMAGSDAPHFRLSGARPARARSGVEALIGLGVDGILSFGSAGAVTPVHRPGDLLVGTSVMDDEGARYTADDGWSGRIVSMTGASPVNIAGLDYIANTEDKIRFAGQGIAAIDMESHWAGQLAGEAGIPFAVLRAVVDPDGFDIPAYALDAVRSDGSISLLPIVAGLVTQPWTIGRLLDLNSYNKRAMARLSGAARVLGPGFGLFTL